MAEFRLGLERLFSLASDGVTLAAISATLVVSIKKVFICAVLFFRHLILLVYNRYCLRLEKWMTSIMIVRGEIPAKQRTKIRLRIGNHI